MIGKKKGILATLTIAVLSLPLSAQAGLVPTSPIGPSYRLLGYEGETVKVTRKSNVAYGAGDTFLILYGVTGTLPITNAFFGDPLPGVPKAAYYELVDDPPSEELLEGPDGFWYLGKEGYNLDLPNPVDLAYGIGERLIFKDGVQGPIQLTNIYFGGDPAPNVHKHLWIRFPKHQSILASTAANARDMIIQPEFAQGYVRPNTNLALPSSYNYKEYVFPESNGLVQPRSPGNPSARIQKVSLAQTHVMEPSHPFFFLIAQRPALLEVAVVGEGPSPDVSVEGSIGGSFIGRLYLQGPPRLRNSLDLSQHSFDDRFTVTLPSSWLRPGLSLRIRADQDVRNYSADQLKVGYSPEINLFMVNMDILDFNQGKADVPIPDNFLGEFAAAMPASVTRLGTFPARMSLPWLAVHKDGQDAPVVLTTGDNTQGVHEGNINAAAMRFIEALVLATGDISYSYIYGNTQNFFPGGWGGGKAFVGADYGDVFLHEMGHGLSLPHWSINYGRPNHQVWDYNYPYGGETGGGGGRGESWNFYQNSHEYVSPLIKIPGHPGFGTERSDAMQRANHAKEVRVSGPGLWDGFGDFSALAMYRFMVGAPEIYTGTVPYRGGQAAFQFSQQGGYPDLKLDSQGRRILVRDNPATSPGPRERYDFYVPQVWDTPVYTIYGSYHPYYTNANILYEPMSYRGNLPAMVDPIDPETFARLKDSNSPYEGHFWGEKDLTLRLIYADGTVRHALYPFGGVDRNWSAGRSPWRRDILYFALNVPADRDLRRIELYHRPFAVRNPDDSFPGNIRNPNLGITSSNFMQGARLIAARDVSTRAAR